MLIFGCKCRDEVYFKHARHSCAIRMDAIQDYNEIRVSLPHAFRVPSDHTRAFKIYNNRHRTTLTRRTTKKKPHHTNCNLLSTITSVIISVRFRMTESEIELDAWQMHVNSAALYTQQYTRTHEVFGHLTLTDILLRNLGYCD